MSGALSVRVVPLAAEHAEQVLAIYQAGVDEGNATFETAAPAWEAFDAAKLPEHRFSAIDERGTVLGWVAASRVSDRCAYAGVVEHSVYVQSGIFPENAASLAVHERAGFRVIGTRERIGRHHGVWRDVVLLERRSPTIT
ncbi:GNAT family N-acetyltransferase [Streptomyces griseus]|uniref:GNAT family N-acetyltransferase n=1 Tax=Streptomyces griseus TaxID=1911 RepID=UPI003868B1CC|nr:GNAT family N-acetyltransferase [Streptomyces fimicarius]